MSNFSLIRMMDFLHYFLILPHKRVETKKDSFVADFINNVLCDPKNELLKVVENTQSEFIRNKTTLEIEDFGAGSRNNENKYRRICDIARNASSTSRKCRILFQLVKHYKPSVIIELGTSLGIGTLCLSLANKKSMVYTLEGSLDLHKLASGLFKRLGLYNITPVLGKFDEVLPELLTQLGAADMYFIDGNHTQEATLRYFEIAKKYSKSGSFLVFDDIRWSEGMYAAWIEICRHPETILSIDLLDIGIVFIDHKIIKQNLQLYY